MLDLDATDDPLHGHQEGRFFHGYYDCYCYLPLYVFCGRHLLAAKLRRPNIDASAGAVEEVERIVGQIRARWPRVRILLRADSGFAREALMAWCEHNGVDYLFGLAKNARLVGEIAGRTGRRRRAEPADRQAGAGLQGLHLGDAATAGAAQRRVVAKAEWTGRRGQSALRRHLAGPREHEARHLYEKLYCARGEMENRIKECQLDLFADRTSADTMRANQLRLWFASMAYVLVCALRRIGLQHTQFAHASCGTIRLKLLEDRRAGSDQRPPHQDRHGLGLSLPVRVPCRPCRARRGGLTTGSENPGSITPQYTLSASLPLTKLCKS